MTLWAYTRCLRVTGPACAFSDTGRSFAATTRTRTQGWKTLARLALIDPQLLGPAKHRNARAQADLTVIRARTGLVRARTALVNTARGLAMSCRDRLRGCNVRNMNPEKAEELSPELQTALQPLLACESLSEHISECNERAQKSLKISYLSRKGRPRPVREPKGKISEPDAAW